MIHIVIATDLVTPLAAYVRLRAAGPAGFLLESVQKGRLGRHPESVLTPNRPRLARSFLERGDNRRR